MTLTFPALTHAFMCSPLLVNDEAVTQGAAINTCEVQKSEENSSVATDTDATEAFHEGSRHMNHHI